MQELSAEEVRLAHLRKQRRASATLRQSSSAAGAAEGGQTAAAADGGVRAAQAVVALAATRVTEAAERLQVALARCEQLASSEQLRDVTRGKEPSSHDPSAAVAVAEVAGPEHRAAAAQSARTHAAPAVGAGPRENAETAATTTLVGRARELQEEKELLERALAAAEAAWIEQSQQLQVAAHQYLLHTDRCALDASARAFLRKALYARTCAAARSLESETWPLSERPRRPRCSACESGCVVSDTSLLSLSIVHLVQSLSLFCSCILRFTSSWHFVSFLPRPAAPLPVRTWPRIQLEALAVHAERHSELVADQRDQITALQEQVRVCLRERATGLGAVVDAAPSL